MKPLILLLCLLPSPDAEPADATTHRLEWRPTYDRPGELLWSELWDSDDGCELGTYFNTDAQGCGLGYHEWARGLDGVHFYRTIRAHPPLTLPARYR